MKSRFFKSEKGFKISIGILYMISFMILISGIIFGILCFIDNTHFTVLTSSVHGSVFGLVIAFLGFRYVASVRKLSSGSHAVLKRT